MSAGCSGDPGSLRGFGEVPLGERMFGVALGGTRGAFIARTLLVPLAAASGFPPEVLEAAGIAELLAN